MSTPVDRSASQPGKLFGKVEKNPAMGLFMLGAIALTAKLTRDTYVGNEQREEQGVSAERAKKDYALMMYDAGSMSGKGPMWDGFRHLAKWMDLYGPYGIKEDLQEWRDKVHSIWKEVIIPNLIPMGVSLGAMYAYFGPQNMHKPFKKAGAIFAEKLREGSYGSGLWKYTKKAGGTVTGWGASLTKAALENPLVAAGVLLLGAFGYKTWYEVKTGRAQDEYFRHELFIKDGREE